MAETTALPAGFKEVSDGPPPGFKEVARSTPDTHGPLVGGILDTFGLTGRTEARTPLKVALHPEGVLEHLAQAALVIPATYFTGGAAGALAGAAGAPAAVTAAAPFLGRMAATGALSKARGETTTGTFGDVAAAAVGEGVLSGLGAVASKVAGPAMRAAAKAAESSRIGKAGSEVLPELAVESDRELWGAAQQWGKKQIERVFQPAIKEIEARLGGARSLVLPSVGPKAVSFGSAIDKMFAASGEARREVAGEIQAALTGINKEAAEIFRSALEARAAGYTYLGALKKGMDASGQLDPSKLQKYVNANYDKLQNFAGRYWPKIEEALLGPGKKAPVEIAPRAEATKIAGHTIKAPESVSRAAEKAAPVLSNPALRAGLDVALGQQPASGMTLGATAAMIPGLIRKVPGVSHLGDVMEEHSEATGGF